MTNLQFGAIVIIAAALNLAFSWSARKTAESVEIRYYSNAIASVSFVGILLGIFIASGGW